MEENKSLPDKANATKNLTNNEKPKTKFKISKLITFILKHLNFPKEIKGRSKDYRKVKPFLINNKIWFENEIQSFIIHSKKKYVLSEFNKLSIMKYFIFSISYFFSCLNIELNNEPETPTRKDDLMYTIYKKIQLVVLTLVKLYSDNFFTIEDLLYFAKYLAMLSLADHSEYTIPKNPNNPIKHFFFLGCSIELIKNVVCNSEKIIQNFSYNEEIEKTLDEYLSFLLNTFIKSNPSNLYLFYQYGDKNTNLFSFLDVFKFISTEKFYEKTKNILLNFFTEIYQYHFSYKGIMAPWLNYMKQILINIEKKTFSDIFYDISLADFPISYLNAIFQKEQEEKKKHPIILDNGVYRSGNRSPLILTGLTLSSSYTLVFSFNFVPLFNENKQDYYQILSISEENGTNVFLKIYLIQINNSTKYLLKIERHIKGTKEITNTIADTQIEVEPYYTYIFSISGNKKEKKIKINFLYKDKIEEQIIELPKYSIVETQTNIMKIGYDISNNKIIQEFDGFLGAIMFFKTELNVQYLENLLMLRGKYDNYVYFNENCDISYLQKYTGKNENVHLFSYLQDYFLKGKDNKDIFNKLHFIFTSKVFQFNEIKNEIGYYDEKEIKENLYKNEGLFNIDLSNRDSFRNSQASKSGSSNQENIDSTSKKLNIYGIKENVKNNEIKVKASRIMNKEFFVFSNKPSLSEFLKYDGISFLSLQFEYYFQILSHLQEIDYNDFWIDIILKM